MAQGIAYDFSAFEPRRSREDRRAVPLTVTRRKPNLRAARRARSVKLLAVMGACAAVMCFALYNRAQLTELTSEVGKAQRALSVLQSESTKLQLSLEGSVSLRNVEEIAQVDLGLVKAEPTQTILLTLSEGDKVVIEEGDGGFFGKIWDGIAHFFSGAKEYLNFE